MLDTGSIPVEGTSKLMAHEGVGAGARTLMFPRYSAFVHINRMRCWCATWYTPILGGYVFSPPPNPRTAPAPFAHLPSRCIASAPFRRGTTSTGERKRGSKRSHACQQDANHHGLRGGSPAPTSAAGRKSRRGPACPDRGIWAGPGTAHRRNVADNTAGIARHCRRDRHCETAHQPEMTAPQRISGRQAPGRPGQQSAPWHAAVRGTTS